MVLGFNPRFVDPILSNKKIHTIRADVHDRWKADNSIQMATGVRTNQFNLGIPGLDKCISTQKIVIERNVYTMGDYVIEVDGNQLSESEVSTLAKNDGFDSVVDFFKWFDKDLFSGKLILWTNARY